MRADAWAALALLALLAVAAGTVKLRWRRRARWLAGGAIGILVVTGLGVVMAWVGKGTIPLLWSERRAPLPQVHTPSGTVAVPGRGSVPGTSRTALSGTVTWVRDGDTIVVERTPIRFADIDCAENGTEDGNRATAALRSLATGQPVTCQLEGRRSYDREVGICALADGRNLGMVLVARGLCVRR